MLTEQQAAAASAGLTKRGARPDIRRKVKENRVRFLGRLLSGRLPLPPLRCRFSCNFAAPSCWVSAATCHTGINLDGNFCSWSYYSP